MKIVSASILLFLAASVSSFSQPWMKKGIPAADIPGNEKIKPNLYRIAENFEQYWKGKDANRLDETENAEEGGYQQFKRWEYMMKRRTFPSGDFYPSDILFEEYQKTKNAQSLIRLSSLPQWNFVGPAVVPNSGGGAGRVNVIAIDPTNTQILYCGGASGGIWKSTDGGQSWSTLNTDLLPSISIADIAINPRYPDSVYVATGDGYGYETGTDFWGGLYTAGIFVSGDGGQSWQQAGLSRTQFQKDIIQRLVIHPTHPEILLASTRNGMYRTTDGGQNWTQVSTRKFFDIEFKKTNPDTVFASMSTGIYRSINAGQTWTLIRGGLCSGRLMIELTDANPNIIYALCETGTLFKSTDQGLSFTRMSPPSDATTFYGYYDCVLAVSPTDPNLVYCGGLDIVKSTDGGASWSPAANLNGSLDYVHVDLKWIKFIPGTANHILATSDGGVFKTTDGGINWSDLSNGLAIKQYYRISSSASNPNFMLGGAQDNGTDRWFSGNWTHIFGGDGMDNQFDQQNDQTIYFSYQNGEIYRSTNRGVSSTRIAPSSNGEWVTPFVLNPRNSRTIYAGYSDIFRSYDRGTNWTQLSNNLGGTGDLFNTIALTKADTNYIYAATLRKLYRSSDNGTTWINVTGSLPIATAGAISGVTISTTDPQKVWLSFSGYVSGQKIYASVNGGLSWTNISTGIPNIPVDCIIYQDSTNDALYAGTDLGVYYSVNGLQWQPINNGLPNVIVTDLDIHYGSGKIRAGTYGRGIWESPLIHSSQGVNDVAVLGIVSPSERSCDTTIAIAVNIRNSGINTLNAFRLNYGADGDTSNVYLFSGSIPPLTDTVLYLPSINLQSGLHSISIVASDPNGQADDFIFNNIANSNFNLIFSRSTVPFTENFEAGGVTWGIFPSVNDSSSAMYTSSLGAFGQSRYSLAASFYYEPYSTAVLGTGIFDFSSALAPLNLSFDVAHSLKDLTTNCRLIITATADCGNTTDTVFDKSGSALTTAAMNANSFQPGAGEWRSESVDISRYIGESSVYFNFIFDNAGSNGNNVYIDNIRFYDNAAGFSDESISIYIYPNPLNDQLLIDVQHEGNYLSELKDISGRVVSTYSISKGKTAINTSALASGVYYLTLSKEDQIVKTSVLVKH